ncbi:ATP-dependent DNA helicase PIF1 [Hirsutella rhossiliensis]
MPCAPQRLVHRNVLRPTFRRASNDEPAKEEGKRIIGQKGKRDHFPANAIAVATMRYADDSDFSGLSPTSTNVVEFTALARILPFGLMMFLHREGIPQNMPLHRFWLDYHDVIRMKAHYLAEQYFSVEISIWLYPQTTAELSENLGSQIEVYGSIIPDGYELAEGAALDKAKTALQTYLFVGLKRSDKRRQEGPGNITFSVNLHMPKCEGSDFFLEIWVCYELGKHIVEASMESLESMADMLGDFVFAGVDSSRLARKAGPFERANIMQVCRDANDFKVLLPMGFAEGYKLYKHLYFYVLLICPLWRDLAPRTDGDAATPCMPVHSPGIIDWRKVSPRNELKFVLCHFALMLTVATNANNSSPYVADFPRRSFTAPVVVRRNCRLQMKSRGVSIARAYMLGYWQERIIIPRNNYLATKPNAWITILGEMIALRLVLEPGKSAKQTRTCVACRDQHNLPDIIESRSPRIEESGPSAPKRTDRDAGLSPPTSRTRTEPSSPETLKQPSARRFQQPNKARGSSGRWPLASHFDPSTAEGNATRMNYSYLAARFHKGRKVSQDDPSTAGARVKLAAIQRDHRSRRRAGETARRLLEKVAILVLWFAMRVKIDCERVDLKAEFSESDIDAEDYANVLLSPARPRRYLEQLGVEPDSEPGEEDGNGNRDDDSSQGVVAVVPPQVQEGGQENLGEKRDRRDRTTSSKSSDNSTGRHTVWNGDLDASPLTDRNKATLRDFWANLDNDQMEYCSRCREYWFQMEIDYDGICSRCYRRDERRGPDEPYFFSAENQLDFGPVPARLPELTPTEEALFARVHVHVNIMLVRGQQYKYRGHVVHFLREVGLVYNQLPLLPPELNTVLLRPANTSSHANLSRQFIRQFHKERLSQLPEDGNVLDAIPQSQVEAADVGAEEDQEAEPDLEDAAAVPDLLAKDTEHDALRSILAGESEADAPQGRRSTSSSFPTYGTRRSHALLSLAFPCLFPDGRADFVEPRLRSIEYKKYIEHAMRWHDGRFARHPTFRFVAFNTLMRPQARARSKFFVKQQDGSREPLTREQLIEALEHSEDPEAQALINSITRHAVSIRGTRPFWNRKRQNLEAYTHDLARLIYTGGASTNTCPDMKRQDRSRPAARECPCPAHRDWISLGMLRANGQIRLRKTGLEVTWRWKTKLRKQPLPALCPWVRIASLYTKAAGGECAHLICAVSALRFDQPRRIVRVVGALVKPFIFSLVERSGARRTNIRAAMISLETVDPVNAPSFPPRATNRHFHVLFHPMSELPQEIEKLQRLLKKARREKEEAKAREEEAKVREEEAKVREEEAKAREEEAKAREEEERRKSQKTTLEEYLYNCHFHLYTKLGFADKSKSSTGLATRVDNKYYPKWLRPWNTFASYQRHQHFDEIRRVCGESRLFHQESTTRNLGATVSYDPAGNENAVEYFEKIAVEVPVREILAPVWDQEGSHGEHRITMLRFSHNVRDFTQPSDSRIGDDHPNEERQERRRPAGTTMRIASTREFQPPPVKPDGGAYSMAFVYDFKAAHKFAAAYLKATLAKEKLFSEVIARYNSNKYKSNAKLQEQEREETRIAMALTQVFDYMVWYGVAYGYVAAGKSLVFLHMDRDKPQTLYYHLCMPNEEVVEVSAGDRARQVPHTAVAQLASFCLRQKELKNGEPYEDLRLLGAEGTDSSSPSSSQGTEGSEFQSVEGPTNRVYPLRSSSSQKRGRRRRWSEETNTNERRQCPSSGSCDHQETETSDPGPTRQYCTQACLLSLKRGWDLDANCPNVPSHRTAEGGIRHPIDAGEFTRLVGERLRRNPYRNCKALDGQGKVGATGVLFKLELAPYGYTFVGKGTLSDHLYRLEHESRIYAHLDKLQGEVVPVHFDIVRLARVTSSWRGKGRSHDANVVGRRSGRGGGVPDLAAEVRRSSQAVWAEGVDHGDEREPNLLWNDERRRVMLVDFDRANLLPAPKHKQLFHLSRDKRKRQRDGFGARSRKRGLLRDHLQPYCSELAGREVPAKQTTATTQNFPSSGLAHTMNGAGLLVIMIVSNRAATPVFVGPASVHMFLNNLHYSRAITGIPATTHEWLLALGLGGYQQHLATRNKSLKVTGTCKLPPTSDHGHCTGRLLAPEALLGWPATGKLWPRTPPADRLREDERQSTLQTVRSELDRHPPRTNSTGGLGSSIMEEPAKAVIMVGQGMPPVPTPTKKSSRVTRRSSKIQEATRQLEDTADRTKRSARIATRLAPDAVTTNNTTELQRLSSSSSSSSTYPVKGKEQGE